MCLLAAVAQQAAEQWVERQKQACRRISKATRPALQKAQAHVARAALAKVQMNESTCPFPMSRPQVLQQRYLSRARIRLESTVDRPSRGLRGGDAGRGSGVNQLHPI